MDHHGAQISWGPTGSRVIVTTGHTMWHPCATGIASSGINGDPQLDRVYHDQLVQQCAESQDVLPFVWSSNPAAQSVSSRLRNQHLWVSSRKNSTYFFKCQFLLQCPSWPFLDCSWTGLQGLRMMFVFLLAWARSSVHSSECTSNMVRPLPNDP